jgi:hypothetical protein
MTDRLIRCIGVFAMMAIAVGTAVISHQEGDIADSAFLKAELSNLLLVTSRLCE